MEDTGFKHLMTKAEPRYVLPSRATFRNKLIPNPYEDVKGMLKTAIREHFLSEGGLVSITTDVGTARTVRSYVTYTIHLINSEFEMKSYNLGTFHFTKDHTADNLRRQIYEILTDAGLLNVNPQPQAVEAGDSESEDMDTDARGLCNFPS